LALDAPLDLGVNASTKFGGTAPLKIWEGKKTSGQDNLGVEQKNCVKFRPLRTKL